MRRPRLLHAQIPAQRAGVHDVDAEEHHQARRHDPAVLVLELGHGREPRRHHDGRAAKERDERAAPRDGGDGPRPGEHADAVREVALRQGVSGGRAVAGALTCTTLPTMPSNREVVASAQ